MFARSTTIRANPDRVDEGIQFVRDNVMPMVTEMDGCIGLSMLVDRVDGRSIVTTAWLDADAMAASAEGVRAARERAEQLFEGRAEVAEWEIALLHRAHEAPSGACTRVTWSRVQPDRVDEAIDVFRDVALSRAEALPGFCSASLLVNRQTGSAASAVTYDSREALERSREAARGIRSDAAQQAALEILDVAEFDLEIAHLRVPETV